MAVKKSPVTTVKKLAPKKKPAARTTKRKKKPATAWQLYRYIILGGVLLILLSPFYYGYVLKTFSATWRWIADIGENPNYRTYTSFHIRIPAGYQLHGIDVSYAQGKIDWPKVRAMKEDSVQISFAFVKATEGLLTVDPYFKRNWREAPKAGIVCGPYHFLHPEKNGLWQARFFLQNVKLEKGDLPAVADIEQLNGVSPQKMRDELLAFLQQVETKTKVTPIIYTNLRFYQDYLAGHVNGYPLWIANFNQPALPLNKGAGWRFWQHSETGRMNGIGHTVDFNVFNGDSLAFQRLLVR